MLETQPRQTIRTLVASFLFTDLVGFSKGTAADQYSAKAKLSGVLRRHLAPLKEEDYWIKDTGDGALIAFVSNPEHALYMALALGQDYGAGAAEATSTSSGSLRTGLHLGTVKESIDVEARRNFIGDGINAAKRIMDFAHPGQITASRAFFEAIANLDAAYAALFQHVGAADDKHGRAHDLYSVAPSASVLDRLRDDLVATSGAVEAPSDSSLPAASASESRSGRLKRPILIASALVAVAAIAITQRLREPSTQVPPAPPTAARPSPDASSLAGKAPAVTAPSPPEVQAPMPSIAAPAATRASPPTSTPADVQRRDPESQRPTAPPVARAPPEARPRATASAPAGDTKPAAPASPRCTLIVEKAALGEPLTAEEKRELASCR